jgi:hypothetical protein
MATPKKKRTAKWAKNTKAYEERKKKEGEAKRMNTEDLYVKGGRSKRIRDVGQKPPKGYMRTGGRYLAKIENMRTIKSKTSMAQRAMFYSNKEKWLGVDGRGGWLGSAANQGMYNGDTSEANFRKTAGARKMIDADGGTYAPDYHPKQAGVKTRSKSRYIMAIGQDGHMR